MVSNSPTLRIAARHHPCGALGFARGIVIWLQGCARRCAGCIAPEYQDPSGGVLVPLDGLARWVTARHPADGITISGGEPMEQASGLAGLLGALATARPELPVLLFTGFSHEDLRRHGTSDQRRVLHLIDVLVDGDYREQLEPASLRGSANQRIIGMTARGRALASALERWANPVEVTVDETGFHAIGIPPRGFRASVAAALEARGISGEDDLQ